MICRFTSDLHLIDGYINDVKASTITADERALFEEQGFLIRRAIFTGATLSSLQDDALAVAAAFDENYGRITLLEATAAQALEKAQAVFVRQAQIENHQVEAGCAQQRVGLPGRSGMGHAEALGFEPGDDATGDQCVVFCQQYVHVGIA